jgi:polyisoprenoid-binding protein YceI
MKLTHTSVFGFALSVSMFACEEQKAATPTPVTTTTSSATVAAAAPSASATMTAKPVATVAAAPALPSADYAIDVGHSQVGFSVKHMMVSNVKGSFKKFAGNVHLDESDLSKMTVELSIETDSVDSADVKRDTHLKSPEFFDVKKFPKMTFKSTKVERAGEGYKVMGDLTIRDVTKPVELSVTGLSGESKDPWGGFRRGATATAKVNRTDFGLKWNAVLETGGVAVAEEVTLILEVELLKKKDTAASATATAKPSATAK